MLRVCAFVAHALCSATLHVNATPMGGSYILSGLVDEMHTVYADRPRSLIAQQLATSLATVAADEGLPAGDLSCSRDYAQACPEHWIDDGDGHCSVPPSYSGQCVAGMRFSSMTPIEKGREAESCAAVFPCAGSCYRDMSALCPESWDEDVAQECVAPPSYAGPCVATQRLVALSSSEKVAFAQDCNVQWPCAEHRHRGNRSAIATVVNNDECVTDYSAECPDQWHVDSVGGNCRAPVSYEGVCAYRFNGASMSATEKEAYAKACLTPWLCVPP